MNYSKVAKFFLVLIVLGYVAFNSTSALGDCSAKEKDEDGNCPKGPIVAKEEPAPKKITDLPPPEPKPAETKPAVPDPSAPVKTSSVDSPSPSNINDPGLGDSKPGPGDAKTNSEAAQKQLQESAVREAANNAAKNLRDDKAMNDVHITPTQTHERTSVDGASVVEDSKPFVTRPMSVVGQPYFQVVPSIANPGGTTLRTTVSPNPEWDPYYKGFFASVKDAVDSYNKIYGTTITLEVPAAQVKQPEVQKSNLQSSPNGNTPNYDAITKALLAEKTKLFAEEKGGQTISPGVLIKTNSPSAPAAPTAEKPTTIVNNNKLSQTNKIAGNSAAATAEAGKGSSRGTGDGNSEQAPRTLASDPAVTEIEMTPKSPGTGSGTGTTGTKPVVPISKDGPALAPAKVKAEPKFSLKDLLTLFGLLGLIAFAILVWWLLRNKKQNSPSSNGNAAPSQIISKGTTQNVHPVQKSSTLPAQKGIGDGTSNTIVQKSKEPIIIDGEKRLGKVTRRFGERRKNPANQSKNRRRKLDFAVNQNVFRFDRRLAPIGRRDVDGEVAGLFTKTNAVKTGRNHIPANVPEVLPNGSPVSSRERVLIAMIMSLFIACVGKIGLPVVQSQLEKIEVLFQKVPTNSRGLAGVKEQPGNIETGQLR